MQARPILFVATAGPDQSLQFYQEVLGLRLISDQPHAIVFDAGGNTLRVQKVEQVVPPPYTVLGWEVEDIVGDVIELGNKGVVFEFYPFLAQDDTGIWTTPDGARVAWFKDPDGNTLSITQDC